MKKALISIDYTYDFVADDGADSRCASSGYFRCYLWGYKVRFWSYDYIFLLLMLTIQKTTSNSESKLSTPQYHWHKR